MRPRRGDSPGQYRRADAEELYKTGARGGVQQEVRQRRSRRKGGGGGEEQTDKNREPLTEVRE